MKRRSPSGPLDRLSRSHQLFRPMNFTLVKLTPYLPNGRFSPCSRAPLKVHTADGVPWSDHLSTLMSTSFPTARTRGTRAAPRFLRRDTRVFEMTSGRRCSASARLIAELELKDELSEVKARVPGIHEDPRCLKAFESFREGRR